MHDTHDALIASRGLEFAIGLFKHLGLSSRSMSFGIHMMRGE